MQYIPKLIAPPSMRRFGKDPNEFQTYSYDTLTTVSIRSGLSVQTLMLLNGMKSPRDFKAGQVIKLGRS